MKKELSAAVLLIALSAGSAINLGVLHRLTLEISARIDAACAYSRAGQWDEAVSEAEEAERTWSASKGYTSVFIRHSEADGVSDAFYDLLGAIYGRDPAAVRRSSLLLKNRISSLYDMEKPTLGSIF
ncbi:MAG: DUF4363 family protein [Oscillospiraceae bacterium]|nr:DUF4363 family protein [Oscillospiraceae bacterium]